MRVRLSFFFWAFLLHSNEELENREVYKGLYFRNTPQVFAGPQQNKFMLPHLTTLRQVDRLEEKDGWVRVQLHYNKGEGFLEDHTAIAWIWHSNYAQYVEPYFTSGNKVTDVDALKQSEPLDPKKMPTYTVSLNESYEAPGIPTRDAHGKKIPYWAPATSDSSPMRLIYTVPDMRPRWVPREVVEDYHHVAKSKVDYMVGERQPVIKKGDHVVELGFDSKYAKVYNLNDPDRIVYQIPVEQFRSKENTIPLKTDLTELDSREFSDSLETTSAMVAKVPAGRKQEFVNSKMKSVTYNGPLKLVKVADGQGSFSWATRVEVIDSKGKSLGNFYINDKNFSQYQVESSGTTNVAAEDEGESLRDSSTSEVPESSDQVSGHLGKILGSTATKSVIPVHYDANDKYCGERAGKYSKYYYEEPKLTQRSSKYKKDIANTSQSTDVAPGLIAAMLHIESKFNPELENMTEKNSVGGNQKHNSNPSIWGKGIAQLGRAEGKVLGLDWYGIYSKNVGTPGTVWHPASAIDGMAELLLKKVKEINDVEAKHNELVAKGLRKHKIEPAGSLAKFMLDRANFQPPPALNADGSNKAEVELFHQVAFAERMRYLTSMYNRGMRAPKAILAYLERTGKLPGYYGQAWSEPPHATQGDGEVLYKQQINRGHIYRAAGLCGVLAPESAIAKYSADYNYDSSTNLWSVK